MAINAKEKKFEGKKVDQPNLDAGTYPGRVVQVLDMGVQEQRPFKGEAKPPVQELMVTYEFADEFIKDEDGNDVEDKPRWLSEVFALHPLASDLAKSTKRYYAIDPEVEEDGNWGALVTRPVMITVVNNPGTGKNAGKVFNNIASISAMRKKEADKLPELKNPAKVLDLDDADTADIMLTLPEWIQDKIKNGLEWEGCAVQKALSGGKKEAKEEKKAPAKKARVVSEEEFDEELAKPEEENDW